MEKKFKLNQLQYRECIWADKDGNKQMRYGIAHDEPLNVGDVFMAQTIMIDPKQKIANKAVEGWQEMHIYEIVYTKPYTGGEWKWYTLLLATNMAEELQTEPV